MNSVPHNLAAEMAVIGAVLMDNGALSRVQDQLSPDDFYGPANQAIWEVITDRIAAGHVADGVTLKEHFTKSDTLKEIGGPKYLVDLMESAAFGPEISDYAQLIRDMAGRRRLMDAARAILREAEGHDGVEGRSLDEMAAIAQREIDRATRVAERRRFKTLPVIAVQSITERLLHRGGGTSTGLKNLDRKLGGLKPGRMYVLAARPSMGKTALALELASNVARQPVPEGETGGVAYADGVNRRVVGFFSLEMEAEEIAQRALSAEMYRSQGVRLAYSSMGNGWVKPQHKDAIAAAAEQMPLVQVDDAAGITLGYIKERCSALIKTFGRLDLVVVDYLQLMNVQFRNKEENMAGALGRVTAGLKSLAKELAVPVVALSQLSRALESREDKRPQLADLRDSGSIEQDADVVMFVYREHYYLERQGEPKKAADKPDYQNALDRSEPCFDIIVAKQRGGPIGDVRQFWDGATGHIADTREEVTKS